MSGRWKPHGLERTLEFVEGLGEEGFLECFLGSSLGATTHISVLDGKEKRI